jgi:hypothetical protein
MACPFFGIAKESFLLHGQDHIRTQNKGTKKTFFLFFKVVCFHSLTNVFVYKNQAKSHFLSVSNKSGWCMIFSSYTDDGGDNHAHAYHQKKDRITEPAGRLALGQAGQGS